MSTYAPIVISAAMLICSVLTFCFARTKDRDAEKENAIQVNIKLDNLTANTNTILRKMEAHETKIQRMETDIAVINRDLKTAFQRIDELKEK